MNTNCQNCPIRKFYALCFDIHFYGEDCPFKCEKEDNNVE